MEIIVIASFIAIAAYFLIKNKNSQPEIKPAINNHHPVTLTHSLTQ